LTVDIPESPYNIIAQIAKTRAVIDETYPKLVSLSKSLAPYEDSIVSECEATLTSVSQSLSDDLFAASERMGRFTDLELTDTLATIDLSPQNEELIEAIRESLSNHIIRVSSDLRNLIANCHALAGQIEIAQSLLSVMRKKPPS
jgi:hypothetical protein